MWSWNFAFCYHNFQLFHVIWNKVFWCQYYFIWECRMEMMGSVTKMLLCHLFIYNIKTSEYFLIRTMIIQDKFKTRHSHSPFHRCFSNLLGIRKGEGHFLKSYWSRMDCSVQAVLSVRDTQSSHSGGCVYACIRKHIGVDKNEDSSFTSEAKIDRRAEPKAKHLQMNIRQHYPFAN
jgi:hypothetical protein